MSAKPLDNLHRLSEREFEVLERFCQGQKYKDIGSALFITENTVKSHMATIYVKFGLDLFGAAERRKILFQEICPNLKNQIVQPKPPSEIIEIIHVPPGVEDMVEEDEKALLAIDPEVIQISPIPPENGGQKGVSGGWVFVAGIIGLVLGAVVIYILLTRFSSRGGELAIQTDVPIDTVETAVEESVATSTPIPEPTEALPIMEPGYIFEDDFEDGPDPAWEVVRGNMGMQRGRYTVAQSFTRYNTYHYAVLSDYYWQDVSVEIEIQKFTASHGMNIDGLGGIIVNYQENSDSVVLLFHPGSTLVFGYLHPDGQVTTIDASSAGSIGFHTGPHVIRVEVRGDLYYAFVDNERITYTQIPGKPVGQVGLWMRTSSSKDDLEYYAPRVAWIKVEALKPEE